jgi:cytochrome c biogenesis factor
MDLYSILLALHNIFRWVALIAGIVATVRAGLGWFGKRPWQDRDRTLGVIFGSSMDLQLLLGLILYVFLSPLTQMVFDDFGAAMADSGLRFFAIEHLFYMVLAVIFAHLGSALSRRADEPQKKHQRAFIWYGLSVLLMILGIPWARRLLPGL